MKSLSTSVLLMAISIPVSYGADGDVSGFLDMDSISIVSGYKQERAKAPAVFRVINREEILREGHSTLGDVLRRLPGIHVSPSSDAVATVLTSRGLTTRMLLMFDGIETPTGSVNSFGSVDNIPLFNVEYIEIMRGPNSAVFGPDALLGTVNIVTTAESGEGTSVGLIADSFSSLGGHLSTVNKIAGKRLGFSASRYSTDGFSPRIESDRQSQLDAQLRSNASLAPGDSNEEKTISDVRLVLDLSKSVKLRSHYYEQDSIGTGVGFAQALDPDGESKFFAFTNSINYSNVHSDWNVEGNLIHYVTEANGSSTLFPNNSFGGLFPNGVNQFALDAREKRVKAELSGFREFGDHKIRAGINYLDSRWENLSDSRNFVFLPNIPFPVPIQTTMEFLDTPQTFFGDLDYTLSSAFLSDEWNFSNDWTLAGGIRYDDHSTAGSSVSPRVSLIWNKSLYSTYKLLYGEAFRPPSATELSSNGFFIALGDRSLSPSTLRNLEFIAENQLTSTLNSVFSAYTYSLEDVVASAPNPLSTNGQGFVNLSESLEGSGFEWALEWSPSSRIKVKPSWAYSNNKSRTFETESGRLVPRHLLKIESQVRLPNNFDLSISAQRVADRERSNGDQREAVPDYTLVNFAVHKANLFGGVDASLTVRNLFDRDAREPISRGIVNDFPVSGRAVQLRLVHGF